MDKEKSRVAQLRSFWSKAWMLGVVFYMTVIACTYPNDVVMIMMIMLAVVLFTTVVVSFLDASPDSPTRESESPPTRAVEPDEAARIRGEVIDVSVRRAFVACDRLARAVVERGFASATDLHLGRRALAEQALLQLARQNPTRKELFQALADIDPIALRDVVEERLGTGPAAVNQAMAHNETVRLDAVDLALGRRSTEDWSRPLVLFVRSGSELVPADKLAVWNASTRPVPVSS